MYSNTTRCTVGSYSDRDLWVHVRTKNMQEFPAYTRVPQCDRIGTWADLRDVNHNICNFSSSISTIYCYSQYTVVLLKSEDSGTNPGNPASCAQHLTESDDWNTKLVSRFTAPRSAPGTLGAVVLSGYSGYDAFIIDSAFSRVRLTAKFGRIEYIHGAQWEPSSEFVQYIWLVL